ncbi:MAG: dockerin type I domain-containing protein, partial [Planctomycetota bacterium]
SIFDGQTFTITRATDTPITFELDFDGQNRLNDADATNNANVRVISVVGFSAGDPPDALANAIASALNAEFPVLAATNIGGGRITLSGDEFFSLNVAGSALIANGFGGQAAAEPVVVPIDDIRADTLDRITAKFGADNAIVELLGSPQTGQQRIANQYFDALVRALGNNLEVGQRLKVIRPIGFEDATLSVDQVLELENLTRVQVVRDGALGSNDEVVADIELVDRRVIIRNIETVRGESVVQDRVADEVGNELLFGEATIIVGNRFDYGDAPAPYRSTVEDGGPRHAIIDGFFLGDGVSEDVNGNTVDGDDDDGVTITGSLQPGFASAVEFVVNMPLINPPSQAFVDIWFDFDRDGLFENNSDERVTLPIGSFTGSRTLSTNIRVPDGTDEGSVQARIRLSDQMMTGANTQTSGGEVEDYTFEIINNPFSNPSTAEDVNGDGSVSPIDALQVINALNAAGGEINLATSSSFVLPLFPDVDGNGRVTALDALRVINFLNARGTSSEPSVSPAAGEPIDLTEPATTAFAPVADGVLASGATIVSQPRDPESIPSGTESLPDASQNRAGRETSVFDSPEMIHLDEIVDSLAE